MSTLTEADREHFRALAREHHAQWVKEGRWPEIEAKLWRIIHGPGAAVKRGA